MTHLNQHQPTHVTQQGQASCQSQMAHHGVELLGHT